MKLFTYFGSLVRNGTRDSVKSFALFLQSLSSFFMTLFVGFVLAYDVYSNGFIKTDLEMLGIFVLCVYAGVPSSGIPKIFGEKYFNGRKEEEINNKEEDINEEG